MSTTELDPTTYPNLMGVERPFFDFWNSHILRDDDPHRQRWIDYEEGAVDRAEERNRLVARYTDLGGGREYLMSVAKMVPGSLHSVELERPPLVSMSMRSVSRPLA